MQAATLSAAAEADAAAEAALKLQAERMTALKMVTQAATEEVAPAVSVQPLPTAKSAAERADEEEASRKNITSIAEDEEEEEANEGETDDGFATAPPHDGEGSGTASGGGQLQEPSPGPGPVDQPTAPSRAERLMAQFDAVTEAMDSGNAGGGGLDGSSAQSGEDRTAHIRYGEASAALMGSLSDEAMSGIIREDWSSASLLLRSVPALRPKLKTPQVKEQRDKLLALARTPMDSSVLHERILMSIHSEITGSAIPPQRLGPHWEVRAVAALGSGRRLLLSSPLSFCDDSRLPHTSQPDPGMRMPACCPLISAQGWSRRKSPPWLRR